MKGPYPTTQGDLIRAARGELSQVAFAKLVKVDRSCLCRYEKEDLGAPTRLLNYCLQVVATQLSGVASTPSSRAQRALAHARQAVDELEALTKSRPGE